MSLDKLLKDAKFLSDVKRAALNHRDDIIPEFNGELYQAVMFTRGMVDVLASRGYTIEKKEEE